MIPPKIRFAVTGLNHGHIHDQTKSMLNAGAEADMLPYCQEHGIVVMAHGPLAMGLLSGTYSADTVFTDPFRMRWHKDEEAQAAFEQRVAQVEKLKQVVKPGQEMVTTALRYVIWVHL